MVGIEHWRQMPLTPEQKRNPRRIVGNPRKKLKKRVAKKDCAVTKHRKGLTLEDRKLRSAAGYARERYKKSSVVWENRTPPVGGKLAFHLEPNGSESKEAHEVAFIHRCNINGHLQNELIYFRRTRSQRKKDRRLKEYFAVPSLAVFRIRNAS